MHHWGQMACEKLKFENNHIFCNKTFISMHWLILKYSFHNTAAQSINKQNDRDAFDLQNIKWVGQSFYM